MIAGFISFVLAGNWRRWAVGCAVHLAVAVVVTLPILIHNIRYDFVPLQYQWKHSMSSPEPGLLPFLSFVGIQLLLFGVMPFAAFVWAIGRRRELLADPRLRVCACLFGLPFAFFLYKATRGPLEGNWALACYIAVWPLAAAMYERFRSSTMWRRLTVAAFAAPAVCVVFLAIHLVKPFRAISPEADRITRQFERVEVARQVAATLHQAGITDPVYVPSYQWTALLRFYGVDARQIDGVTRPSHFTQFPERPTDRDHALVFADILIPEECVRGFDTPRAVAMFPLHVRGKLIGGFWLLEYSRPPRATGHAAATSDSSQLFPRPSP
jgi:hypothetical protein